MGNTYYVRIKENGYIDFGSQYRNETIVEQIRKFIVKEFGSIDKAPKNTTLKYTI